MEKISTDELPSTRPHHSQNTARAAIFTRLACLPKIQFLLDIDYSISFATPISSF